MADTLPSETVIPATPPNEPGTAAVPPVVNSSADVEAAKKEALQATLRANQLANENAALKAAQDAATQKQLEEKEEFKTLYEQTQSKLNEIQETQAATERQTQLKTATEEVFKGYSADTVELAKTAGLSLAEDSDTARASLKEKLDAFQAKVGGSTPKPGANNPRPTTPEVVERSQLTTRNQEGVSPMALAGAKGDDSVARSYIHDLSAVKRMREIANAGM